MLGKLIHLHQEKCIHVCNIKMLMLIWSQLHNCLVTRHGYIHSEKIIRGCVIMDKCLICNIVIYLVTFVCYVGYEYIEEISNWTLFHSYIYCLKFLSLSTLQELYLFVLIMSNQSLWFMAFITKIMLINYMSLFLGY